MTVGFTCGTFDLFHAGHVSMLKQAKRFCDYLIVGIKIDPTVDKPKKHKPIQSILERQIEIEACKYVDKTLFYEKEEDLLVIFGTYKIDVRFIGSDYVGKEISYPNLCEVVYTNWVAPSTTELRERIKK